MVKEPSFYSVIIGTEILNNRREDSHFDFINRELESRYHTHKASFIIKDDPAFMEDIFRFIKNDKNSVMFCFGGIGSTPDDYTRAVSAKVFGDGKLYLNKESEAMMIESFGKSAVYPNRIEMAHLPKGVNLLKNIVNNVSGFEFDNRFFFMPGFPSMSHSMVTTALNSYYPKAEAKIRKTIVVYSGESDMIEEMRRIPNDIEFASLPTMNNKRETDVSFCSTDKQKLEECYGRFCKFLQTKNINFKEI
jgi:molybdopterin-biosynthesis enzyme MoeA-like protein